MGAAEQRSVGNFSPKIICNIFFFPSTNFTMKSLKINLEDSADFQKIAELLLHIKGIKSVEIADEENTESDLKKAFNKSKNQLKNGDYETLVNDIFEILSTPKSK